MAHKQIGNGLPMSTRVGKANLLTWNIPTSLVFYVSAFVFLYCLWLMALNRQYVQDSLLADPCRYRIRVAGLFTCRP